MVKVSIIIPVYNNEKYLDKCLTSIVNQTLKDIEIICINDGSSDNSLKILKKWQCFDNRIKIINKANGGPISARNAGINIAKGKYIGFVDSDDYIDNEMFYSLYAIADKYDVDIVSSGFVIEGNYTSYHYDYMEEGSYNSNNIQTIREKVFYDIDTYEIGIRGSLWCKLFRANLIIGLCKKIPLDIIYAEDKMLILSCLLECKSAYIHHKAYYHYVYHEKSIVHSSNINYLKSINSVYSYLNELYKHPNFSENMRIQAEIYVIELLYKGINSRMGLKNKNLLWIDPYYLKELNINEKILLYGWGEILDCYKRQLEANGFSVLNVAGSMEEVTTVDNYDILFVAIKNKEKAKSIIDELIFNGVDKDKIRWFDQTEIFWKFAKANGFI